MTALKIDTKTREITFTLTLDTARRLKDTFSEVADIPKDRNFNAWRLLRSTITKGVSKMTHAIDGKEEKQFNKRMTKFVHRCPYCGFDMTEFKIRLTSRVRCRNCLKRIDEFDYIEANQIVFKRVE